ncbi:MAG: hypothetical protein Q9219_006975 [cf. Caloplaca sp. 3 TL-2023]
MSLTPLPDVTSTPSNPQPTSTSSPQISNVPAKDADALGGEIDPQKLEQRKKALDSQRKPEKNRPISGSTASTQPVLVREYSQSSPNLKAMKQSKMRPKRSSSANRNSSEMPSLESFSFQDILASIDPEVHGSIDKIAEICGRSRMSLAGEYGSHLPPQGDFSMPSLQDHAGSIPNGRLEPVEEASSTHEDLAQDSKSARPGAARLSLVWNSVKDQEDLSSAPVTATSTDTSYVQSSAMQDNTRQPEAYASYLPQILTWLRTSRADAAQSSTVSRRDSGATNSLQRILGTGTDTTVP